MTDKETKEELRNEDPITGEPGAHPVGSGLGAAAGGAAAGAAGGAVGGPVGAAVGAVIGGVAGGLAGKAVAENVDPTIESAYWQENYRDQDYVNDNDEYTQYEPAYRYGYESRARHDNSDFAAVEPQLEKEWDQYRGESSLEWSRARQATADAWKRADAEYFSPKNPK